MSRRVLLIGVGAVLTAVIVTAVLAKTVDLATDQALVIVLGSASMLVLIGVMFALSVGTRTTQLPRRDDPPSRRDQLLGGLMAFFFFLAWFVAVTYAVLSPPASQGMQFLPF